MNISGQFWTLNSDTIAYSSIGSLQRWGKTSMSKLTFKVPIYKTKFHMVDATSSYMPVVSSGYTFKNKKVWMIEKKIKTVQVASFSLCVPIVLWPWRELYQWTAIVFSFSFWFGNWEQKDPFLEWYGSSLLWFQPIPMQYIWKPRIRQARLFA